ncbi:hypothetical protein [Vibrio phage vB_pir03]|nr:hypothetical protein [Vibrio phage vB_pir03]
MYCPSGQYSFLTVVLNIMLRTHNPRNYHVR